jgi:hypothetical protein
MKMPKYGLIYEIKGPNSLLAGSYQKLAVCLRTGPVCQGLSTTTNNFTQDR